MPKTRPNKEAERFGRRLTALLTSQGQPRRGAGAYLHRKYGVAVVTANAWLNGEHKVEPPLARKIAEDHGSTFDELYWGDEPREPAANDADWSDVTGYSQAAGLGTGAEAEEYAETHSLKFKATSLRRQGLQARNLAIYYGKGDSMEPTIKDGDAIMFDTSDVRVVDGALYLVQLHGAANAEYYVKRALILDGVTYFESDNPNGDHSWKKPKRMDSDKNPITVVGRVRWIAGWTD